jgi:hypothetical protein
MGFAVALDAASDYALQSAVFIEPDGLFYFAGENINNMTGWQEGEIGRGAALEHFPEKWTPVFPIGNATSVESRALSADGRCIFMVNLIGKRSNYLAT